MKANTTKIVTSVVMIAIVFPPMALALQVGVKTAGMNENGVLLLLLTLSSAVLSVINGFGRHTSKAVSLSAARNTRSESQR
jgi:uncharacterized membrane protein YqaE (UPF0057 family)